MLYWYNKDYPGNMVFDPSFQAVLKSAPAGSVEYYSEYLETNRFPGEDQAVVLRDYMRGKYAHRSISVVVTAGDPTMNFMRKYRDDLFPTATIVFGASQVPPAKELQAGPGMTGLITHHSHKETLDLALKLHPDTRQVFVVSGSLERDKRHETVARERLQGYEGEIAITYLTDLTPKELASEMKSLPERSIVLYVWQQAYNEQGKLLETPDILSLITASTTAPVYGMASWQVGKGIVGGYVRSAEGSAARMAEISLRIVNGERAQDIPVEPTPVKPIFDWREMQRLGIDEKLLPPGSIIKNRASTFWDEYKWHAIGLISLFLFQSALITGLIINRARRKRAQEALRESEVRFRNMANNAPVMVWVTEPDGYCSFLSQSWSDFTGQTPETGLGSGWLNAMHPDDQQYVLETFVAANERHEALRLEYRLRRKDGSYAWAIDTAAPRFSESGEFLGYIGSVIDISDRKRAEEALRESEARFRDMADTAPVMIWLSGPDKFCTYFNKQWLDFTGRTMGEELGFGWTSLIHPDDYERCLATYNTAFDWREPFTMEYKLRRADGEFRWVFDTGTPLLSATGAFLGFIGSCIDITERKAAEQSLMNLSGQLIQAREDECARIARELHDDLSQTVALISLELDRLGQNPPKSQAGLHSMVQAIIGQAAELSGAIHRMSHDLHPSKLAHLGLVAALRSLCVELSQTYKMRIEFRHANVQAGLPKEVSLCLYRIVQESLNNVVRHSGAKEAEVELWGSGQEIRLEVRDTGRGFDVESGRSRKGLGLLSMRERLRLVGGAISIESGISKGTRIEARVPLWRAGAEREGVPPTDNARTTAGG